jgi:ribosome biogenesis protein Nip4
MKAIRDFAFQFGAKFIVNADLMVEKDGRYFLLNPSLRALIRKDFFYAGTYLGKVKNGRFFPSFNLLAILARVDANKTIVNKKAAWLFICGRDIFQKGIMTVRGSRRKGDYTLVLNEFGECLGFGKILCSLEAEEKKTEIAIKNISDIGDFLRREA